MLDVSFAAVCYFLFFIVVLRVSLLRCARTQKQKLREEYECNDVASGDRDSTMALLLPLS